MAKDSEEMNRRLAEQRANMGKDPGSAYSDLKTKYEQQHNPKHGGGGSCFTADTEVLTPQGWKRINSFRQGDLVLSVCLRTRELRARPVVAVKVHGASRIWELQFEATRRCLRTTRAHSFLTDRGWIRTVDLKPGDMIHYIDALRVRSRQELIHVGRTPVYQPTYNLVTYGENDFIVRGAIAHNFTYFRTVRCFAVNRQWELMRLASRLCGPKSSTRETPASVASAPPLRRLWPEAEESFSS